MGRVANAAPGGKPGKSFWETDLADLEAVFLRGADKITDLRIWLNDAVPPQGRPYLGRMINVDKEVDAYLAQRPASAHRWWDPLRKRFVRLFLEHRA